MVGWEFMINYLYGLIAALLIAIIVISGQVVFLLETQITMLMLEQ